MEIIKGNYVKLLHKLRHWGHNRHVIHNWPVCSLQEAAETWEFRSLTQNRCDCWDFSQFFSFFQSRNLTACHSLPAFGVRPEAGGAKRLKPHPLISLFSAHFRSFFSCLSHISLSHTWCKVYAQKHGSIWRMDRPHAQPTEFHTKFAEVRGTLQTHPCVEWHKFS